MEARAALATVGVDGGGGATALGGGRTQSVHGTSCNSLKRVNISFRQGRNFAQGPPFSSSCNFGVVRVITAAAAGNVTRRASCRVASSPYESVAWSRSPVMAIAAGATAVSAPPSRQGCRTLGGRTESSFGRCALLSRGRALNVVRRSSAEQNSDVKVEDAVQELEKQAEESKAAYSEAVDALKDETKKLQDSSEGTSEETSLKAVGVLKDTTERLRDEAEKARAMLAATAAETAQLGKSNLNHLAETAPDPIKGIAESAVDAHLKDKTKQGSKIHDFCLGIPYGAILVFGGLLWFIINGSTEAIRFGVILGGLLLFLTIRSLNVWKEGKSSIPYIKGQAAIAAILFLKDARKYLRTGVVFPSAVAALASGGMLAFYAYVYLSGGNPAKKEKISESTSAA